MIEPRTTALILLAAGRSSRFGTADKLAVPLSGRPLGLHVAEQLHEIPFARRIAVVGDRPLAYDAHGYALVHNENPAAGLSLSIRLGIEQAIAAKVDAALIVLADMPRVTAAHVRAMFQRADGADSIVASTDGASLKPPALFGAGRFASLLNLSGDRGAHHLLLKGIPVLASREQLIDLDTTSDFDSFQN